MPMGGSTKGHSNRGRHYGLLLILAFGAAILGVTVLHKLRERRIFNLLVKDKDRELVSLHLLLQKERDSSQEAKRKIEEMKAKIYTLRNQKMELDNRIMEMQSTISSLKDEQRTIGSALEEKQNEIKTLREKDVEVYKENPQVGALTETLKQKEAEIEDLKQHLEIPTKVWSVSTDDPSNPAVNLTKPESMTWRDRNEVNGLKEESGDERSKGAGESLNESNTHRDGDSSTRGEGIKEDTVGLSDTKEIIGEHSQKSTDEVEGKRIKDSRDGEGLGKKEDTNNANETETTANGGGIQRTKDEYSDNEVTDGKEHGIGGIVEIGNLNSQGGESQELGMNARGGKKLEMPNKSQDGAGSRLRGKHGNKISSKGKRWRIIARNRRGMNAENNEVVSVRSRRFHKNAVESERYKRLSDDELQRYRNNLNMGLKLIDESGKGNDKLGVDGNHQQGESWEVKNNDRVRSEGGEEGKDRGNEVGKGDDSADVNLLKPQNSEDAENKSRKGENTDMDQQIEKRQEVDIKPENFEKPNETAGEASKQKSDELQQQIDTREGDKVDQNSKEGKVADKYEESEDLEVAETQDAAETDFRESRAKLEEDNEESGEETDEPEF